MKKKHKRTIKFLEEHQEALQTNHDKLGLEFNDLLHRMQTLESKLLDRNQDEQSIKS